jgi:nucleoside recognition membrane protein YjiH
MKTTFALIAFLIFISALAGYGMKTEQPKINIDDRTGVLLRTCFSAPDFQYKNIAPVCEHFKNYIVNQTDQE